MINHLLPFQCSTSVEPLPSPPTPTAVQFVADTHDTPVSDPSPDGLGDRMIDHLLPFRRSTSVEPRLPRPTAVQSVADTHDTPVSAGLTATLPKSGGLGEGVIDQADPFHCSTSVDFPSQFLSPW